ncbi:MAG: DoxX family protein [Balneolaceae bacterium]|nr:DoxX family protein [Balneolaceae bacterium]
MVQFLTQPYVSQYLIGAVFIFAGAMHFLKPGIFIGIMPDYIPWHKPMVYISGAAELMGGIGVLIPKTQLWAAWGLIVLLFAVFPANIDMTVQAVKHQGWRSLYTIATMLRLPLQFVVMYWVYWACIQH